MPQISAKVFHYPEAGSQPTDYRMLEMFSHAPEADWNWYDPSAADRRALWAADALHRASNLAQMYSALESIPVRRHFGLNSNGAEADIRALSRAYAELGAHDTSGHSLPCVDLLEAITTRLIRLFSGDRSIALQLSLGDISLPAELRRALILIASELVINALKYAFPDGSEGQITLSLVRRLHVISLVVTDNGVGLSPNSGLGNGNAMMKAMVTMLGGAIHRAPTTAGVQVTVSVPSQSVPFASRSITSEHGLTSQNVLSDSIGQQVNNPLDFSKNPRRTQYNAT